MHKPSLLLVATLASFAPVSAQQHAVTKHHPSACPLARAEAAAAAKARAKGTAPAVAIDGAPARTFYAARSSSLAP